MGPVTAGLVDFTLVATPDKITRREQEIFERYHPYHTKTPPHTHQSGNAGTITAAVQGARGHQPTGSEKMERENSTVNETRSPEPPLSKTEATSIEKCRRRKIRDMGQGKRGTACFTGGTPIPAIRTSWSTPQHHSNNHPHIW